MQVLRAALSLALLCLPAGSAFAACTVEETFALLDRGFSKDEVLALCQGSGSADATPGSAPEFAQPTQQEPQQQQQNAQGPWEGVWQLVQVNSSTREDQKLFFVFIPDQQIFELVWPAQSQVSFGDYNPYEDYKVADVRFDEEKLYFAVEIAPAHAGPFPMVIEVILSLTQVGRLEGQWRLLDTSPDYPGVIRADVAVATRTDCVQNERLRQCLAETVAASIPPWSRHAPLTRGPAGLPSLRTGEGTGYGPSVSDRAHQTELDRMRREGRHRCRQGCNPYGMSDEAYATCLSSCD